MNSGSGLLQLYTWWGGGSIYVHMCSLLVAAGIRLIAPT